MTGKTRRLVLLLPAWAALGCDPAATAPPAAAAPDAPRTWAVLPWDEVAGRVVGREASSEGPASFALLPDGGALVLDQVHERVLRLDAAGGLAGTVALPGRTFDDLAQHEGRAMLVLDRLVTTRLLALDLDGDLLAEVPLVGRGIERGGAVTALLPRPDGVWLEVHHRHSVRVLDRDLEPCDRQVVLGRPVANARSLRAALDERGGANVSLGGRVERAPERTVSLKAGAPVERVVWFDADAAGRVHVVLHEVERSATPPWRATHEQYLLVVLDEELRELGRAAVPFVSSELEQSVEFRLGPDGRLWQLEFVEDGARLVDWGRRAP
ncbi:MAG: hypothetical protein JXB32_07670 [Deltaproteobacteria bacterium]|nr:hypothetical protein [Deltaproteobacteria bacterium]